MAVIDAATADGTARRWLDAWNAHDAAAVVAHFADDVTAASPLIDARRPGSGGRLRGRDAVLAYYEEGLRLAPDLHFELVEVLCGVDQVTIVYRNQRHIMVAETLTMAADGTVVAVQVSYGR
ncbi:MAG TPA: nuclear transport factor 2 family protein [Acidimicrobiales bacterium]|nr:nuclear transport factor 2 family protein [Acidimicrobiales bacterium]